jgi:hypothetical protein
MVSWREMNAEQRDFVVFASITTVLTLIYLALPIVAWAIEAFFGGFEGENEAEPLWFTLFYWLFFLVYTGGFTIKAWQRRNKQPFRARCFTLLMLGVAAGVVMSIWVKIIDTLVDRDLVRASATLCRVTELMLAAAFPGVTIPYLLRCYRLYKIFEWYGTHGLLPETAQNSKRFNKPGGVGSLVPHSMPSVPEEQTVPVTISAAAAAVSNLDEEAEDGFPMSMDSKVSVTADYMPPGASFSELERSYTWGAEDDLGYITSKSFSTMHIDRFESTFNTTLGGVGDRKRRKRTKKYSRKRKNLYTTQALMKWFALCIVPVLVIELVWGFFSVELVPTLPACQDLYNDVSYAFFNIYTIVETLSFVFAVYVIQGVWDEFNIRAELLVVIGMNVVILILQLSGANKGNHILIVVKCYVLFVSSIVIPTIITYTWEPPLNIVRQKYITTMEGVLAHVESYDAFSQFLFYEKDDEMGSDLLSFYVRCSLFEDTDPDDAVLLFETAIDLYLEYLLPPQDAQAADEAYYQQQDMGVSANAYDRKIDDEAPLDNREGIWYLFPPVMIYEIGQTLMSHEEAMESTYLNKVNCAVLLSCVCCMYVCFFVSLLVSLLVCAPDSGGMLISHHPRSQDALHLLSTSLDTV